MNVERRRSEEWCREGVPVGGGAEWKGIVVKTVD